MDWWHPHVDNDDYDDWWHDDNPSTFSSVGTVSFGVARLKAWSKVTKMTRVRTTA